MRDVKLKDVIDYLFIQYIPFVCLSDTVVQGPVAVPHLVPLLMAMEGQDPGEDSERGCQLLYDMLQAARNAALNAPVYQRHAHSLLTGTTRASGRAHGQPPRSLERRPGRWGTLFLRLLIETTDAEM